VLLAVPREQRPLTPAGHHLAVPSAAFGAGPGSIPCFMSQRGQIVQVCSAAVAAASMFKVLTEDAAGRLAANADMAADRFLPMAPDPVPSFDLGETAPVHSTSHNFEMGNLRG